MGKYVQVLQGDSEHLVISVHENNVQTIQKWPRVAPLHVLQTLIHENAHGYETKYELGEKVKVIISVDELEICYESMNNGAYKLLGVQHYKHLKEGWIDMGNEGHERLAGELIRVMPGLKKRVPWPCACPPSASDRATVERIIIHLNDTHHPTLGGKSSDPWDRERIAQWTETLDVDLTVDTSRPAPEPARPRMYLHSTSASTKDSYIQQMIKAAITVDTSSITQALKDATIASDKAAKTIELVFKNIDPDAFEKITGMPYPKKEEEA